MAALKSQWFGDKHDYFKFDLWLELAEKVRGIGNLTYLPMLTPSVSPYEKGNRRERLYDFLQSCRHPSVNLMREFLKREGIAYHPYRDDDDKGFQEGSWNAYFRAVPREWLCDAAILIDPDTGLETKGDYWKRHPEKHITYQNISDVISGCSGNFMVVIFQFLQKAAGQRELDLTERTEKLSKILGSAISVSWIAEKTSNGLGELAFIVIGAAKVGADDQEKLLKDYAQKHDLRVGSVKGAQEIPAP